MKKLVSIILICTVAIVFCTPTLATEDTINVALNKTTEQSSTDFGGDSWKAVDGNNSGEWGDGSVTHTALQENPWWQVDLGETAYIGSIRIWNRTDCCSDRLSDFYVFVSESPFLTDENDPVSTAERVDVWSYFYEGDVEATTEVVVNAPGRYVRIQMWNNSAMLSLAEVEVFLASDVIQPTIPSLSSLWMSDGIFEFDEYAHSYTTLVSGDVDNISITAVAGNSETSIRINEEIVESGSSYEIELQPGGNKVTVEISIDDGPATVYTIMVMRPSGQQWNIADVVQAMDSEFDINDDTIFDGEDSILLLDLVQMQYEMTYQLH